MGRRLFSGGFEWEVHAEAVGGAGVRSLASSRRAALTPLSITGPYADPPGGLSYFGVAGRSAVWMAS